MGNKEVENFLKKKTEAKKTLSAMLDFPAKKPLVGIFLDRPVNEKDKETIAELLKGLSTLDVVVGVFSDEEQSHGFKNVKNVPYNRDNRHLLLTACDIALGMHFNDVEEMLINGTIPVSANRPEIKDYDPNHETGYGFIYEEQNAWSIFAAMVRALETFKFPYDWKHIVREGIVSIKA